MTKAQRRNQMIKEMKLKKYQELVKAKVSSSRRRRGIRKSLL